MTTLQSKLMTIDTRRRGLPGAKKRRRVLQSKRLTKIIYHPYLMPYNLLAVLVVASNLFYGWQTQPTTVATLFNIVLLNFSLALLIRQQYVINLLFRVFTAVPHSWPLWLRRMCGKVYHFGGIHVGSYFCGTLWLAYTCFLLHHDVKLQALFYLICVHVLILLVIMIVALPYLRAKWHNTFERVARYGNWLALLLLWAETYLFWQANGELAWHIPVAVLLLSWHTALPWLRLRKVKVNITTPSPHVALLQFDYGVTPFAGSSTDISLNPLWEWHSFANVPSPQRQGFRLTVSRAGDWTGRFIDRQPTHVWVKGVPAAGVGNIEKLFRRVLWVATGSGLGPCLPHLLSQKVAAHLVWATRQPRATYGDELVDEILAVQPQALIWNTTAAGKPDLVELAWQEYQRCGAEAVICIANKKATWQVVHALESRGVPAFGAIWDS